METSGELATALERAAAVLRRRPEIGLHDDAPATSRWSGGTRVVASHANGTQIASDLPTELGGTGDRITPGWLFRAGLASCAATSIVMVAAMRGITLSLLEVRASSRSDTRGLLSLHDAAGAPVYAGPGALRLDVRIAAPGLAQEALRTLVEDGCRCSPIPNLAQHATPLALRVEVEADADADMAAPAP